MKTPTRYQVEKSIGPDDYEEAELLRRLVAIDEAGRARLNQMLELRPKGLSSSGVTTEELTEREWVHKKLGYNPTTGRMGRPRGRPRAESIPDPLPMPGTELQSCLGDTYKIYGYASAPRQMGKVTIVLYVFNGGLVARSLPNMFAGRLSNGEPLVMWPDDPRQLKPGFEVPLKYRRTLDRSELVAKKGARTATPLDQEHDREADAARAKRRRY